MLKRFGLEQVKRETAAGKSFSHLVVWSAGLEAIKRSPALRSRHAVKNLLAAVAEHAADRFQVLRPQGPHSFHLQRRSRTVDDAI